MIAGTAGGRGLLILEYSEAGGSYRVIE